ncbi:potassium voltage-gated channel subfamily B member 1-like [Lingula anatina]|uniref:Potassium voltage-gated channel subfamily B member 1-like n=1 Tax=Lingula anatina TaxID=7574 RepID=A0A2R2MIU0_LINAN|nr:potassium voltage-gated channel subfamily B member 1-like [Lingula anatina]|eukprot:XP_023930140.1 potassium voltage-gated channel subfamily B member 1-like [Lingula anatina]
MSGHGKHLDHQNPRLLEEEEKAAVTINVSGKKFTTFWTTLAKRPESRLGKLAEDRGYVQDRGEKLFFDRDPAYFGPILNFYRTDILHFPHFLCVPIIRLELQFWEIGEENLAPCCKEIVQTFYKEQKEKKLLEKEFSQFSPVIYNHKEGTCDSYRHRLWVFLNIPSSSRGAKAWMVMYIALLWISFSLLAMNSTPEFRSSNGVNASALPHIFNEKLIMLLTTDDNPIIKVCDIVLNVFFTLEIVVQLFTAPSLCKTLKQFLSVIEVSWLVITWTTDIAFTAKDYLVEKTIEEQREIPAFTTMRVLAYLNVTLRVLRLLRLIPFSRNLQVIILTLKASSKDIGLLVTLLLMGAMIFGPLIFYAEVNGSVSNIDNVLVGCWWALVTMTTVGYGDKYPSAFGGYVIGVVCVVSGMVITGIPISIISNNFNKYQSFAESLKENKRANENEERVSLT